MAERGEPADVVWARVHHRDPTVRGQQVDKVVIRIDRRLPLDTNEAIFRQDAESLAAALWESLPGATVDRLISALLYMRASLLRVGHLSASELREFDEWRARPQVRDVTPEEWRARRAPSCAGDSCCPPPVSQAGSAVSGFTETTGDRVDEWRELVYPRPADDLCAFYNSAGARCGWPMGHDVVEFPHG